MQDYNTRFDKKHDIRYPIKLEFEKKSISHHRVEIWNNISDEIRNSENIKAFKGTKTIVLIFLQNVI